MIIHSYLTDGFFPWAKIYLESFAFHNGHDFLIVLSTRDLKEDQISELYSLYDNLIIKNDSFNYKEMAKKAGIQPKKLLELKRQVEEEHVTEKNKVWKLMVAADDRVKSIYKVMKEYRNEKYMLHTDIDLYFRSQLTELFEFIKQHDISIKLRLKSKLNRRTMIGVQGYRISKKTIRFLERWISYVEEKTPRERPMGYGQTACYYAYKDFIDKCKWGSIKRRFIAPQMLDTDIIWSANTTKGKTKNLEICYEDFRRMKNEYKTNNSI